MGFLWNVIEMKFRSSYGECWLRLFSYMTQSQLVWSFESQSRVKVKVVKLCRKKWFDHNMMYIYHKQYEILQKIIWNSSNGQLWFPIDSLWKWSKRDQNFANAIVFFSNWKIVMPSESWRPGLSENVAVFKPKLGLVEVGSNFKTKNLWRGLF